MPDYLRPGLKLVIVGINPGLRSGATGHHYAFPGNHFWPLLYESGLLPEPLTFAEDHRVLEYDIGLTNLVDRTSREASDLTRAEMQAGAEALRAQAARLPAARRLLQRHGHLRGLLPAARRSASACRRRRWRTCCSSSCPRPAAAPPPTSATPSWRYYRELKALVDRLWRRGAAS